MEKDIETDMQMVFISYSRKNTRFANSIENLLKIRGLHPWLDRQALIGGKVWSLDIIQAIHDCSMFVLILTPDALRSTFVRREYLEAIDKNKTIILLKLQKVEDVPFELRSHPIIDFTHSKRRGMSKLIYKLYKFGVYDLQTTGQVDADLILTLDALNQPLDLWRVFRVPSWYYQVKGLFSVLVSIIIGSLTVLIAFSIHFYLPFNSLQQLDGFLFQILLFLICAMFLIISPYWVRNNLMYAIKAVKSEAIIITYEGVVISQMTNVYYEFVKSIARGKPISLFSTYSSINFSHVNQISIGVSSKGTSIIIYDKSDEIITMTIPARFANHRDIAEHFIASLRYFKQREAKKQSELSKMATQLSRISQTLAGFSKIMTTSPETVELLSDLSEFVALVSETLPEISNTSVSFCLPLSAELSEMFEILSESANSISNILNESIAIPLAFKTLFEISKTLTIISRRLPVIFSTPSALKMPDDIETLLDTKENVIAPFYKKTVINDPSNKIVEARTLEIETPQKISQIRHEDDSILTAFFSPSDIHIVQRIIKRLQPHVSAIHKNRKDTLSDCSALLLFISNASIKSTDLEDIYKVALQYNKPIIPIQINNSDPLPNYLEHLQVINCSSKSLTGRGFYDLLFALSQSGVLEDNPLSLDNELILAKTMHSNDSVNVSGFRVPDQSYPGLVYLYNMLIWTFGIVCPLIVISCFLLLRSTSAQFVNLAFIPFCLLVIICLVLSACANVIYRKYLQFYQGSVIPEMIAVTPIGVVVHIFNASRLTTIQRHYEFSKIMSLWAMASENGIGKIEVYLKGEPVDKISVPSRFFNVGEIINTINYFYAESRDL